MEIELKYLLENATDLDLVVPWHIVWKGENGHGASRLGSGIVMSSGVWLNLVLVAPGRYGFLLIMPVMTLIPSADGMLFWD